MVASQSCEDTDVPAAEEPSSVTVPTEGPRIVRPLAPAPSCGAGSHPAAVSPQPVEGGELEMLSCRNEAAILMKTKDRGQKTKPKRTGNEPPMKCPFRRTKWGAPYLGTNPPLDGSKIRRQAVRFFDRMHANFDAPSSRAVKQ
jgi:hypothetical protein